MAPHTQGPRGREEPGLALSTHWQTYLVRGSGQEGDEAGEAGRRQARTTGSYPECGGVRGSFKAKERPDRTVTWESCLWRGDAWGGSGRQMSSGSSLMRVLEKTRLLKDP